MKLILSRKGFDSKYGGCASPIFEKDSMVSLPIPFPDGAHRLREATQFNSNFETGDLPADLTALRQPENWQSKETKVHLDPYLKKYRANTATGWLPAFGQDGAAQGHLRNQGVDVGDLFLFFGWFRKVEYLKGDGGGWRFIPQSPELHVIFGWLQIGEILTIVGRDALDAEHAWLDDHPHWKQRCRMGKNNKIYIAKKRLEIDGDDLGPGGGTFDDFKSCLQLTEAEQPNRSVWRLPSWFNPNARSPLLSCHRNPDRWTRLDEAEPATRLRSVPIGQEFVLDLNKVDQPAAMAWLSALFALT